MLHTGLVQVERDSSTPLAIVSRRSGCSTDFTKKPPNRPLASIYSYINFQYGARINPNIHRYAQKALTSSGKMEQRELEKSAT